VPRLASDRHEPVVSLEVGDLPIVEEAPQDARRATLSAVRFANGTMEEVRGVVPADAKAGVTVKEPTRGCPLPDFQLADIRASSFASFWASCFCTLTSGTSISRPPFLR
jgi:hypothetical protein